MNMSDEYDYLSIKSEDKQVISNLAEMGEQLKALKIAAEEAAVNAERAKKAYEHYANVIIPQEMFSAGINSISLKTGGTLSIKHNFYCQPNKNAEDRKKIVEWLRANDGGHIIEHDASVSAEDMDKLDKNGIPYIENTSVNTAKLKSFIKDGIGATTGVQRFTIDDIPACIHFQEVTTVDIEV
jgi:hypothetical protein